MHRIYLNDFIEEFGCFDVNLYIRVIVNILLSKIFTINYEIELYYNKVYEYLSVS